MAVGVVLAVPPVVPLLPCPPPSLASAAPQFFADCVPKEADWEVGTGCWGGDFPSALDFFIASGSIMPQDLDYTYIGVQGQCNRCEMPVQSPCLMDGISGIAYMYCSLETVRKQSPFARPWKPGMNHHARLVHDGSLETTAHRTG